ncbi:MAG TPA: endonuclease/exonuclease/phosphatase family protein [Opitutus sp.]|nr:endonuclease/exonuclease/phosphatase family protein [Opitutus sp.]
MKTQREQRATRPPGRWWNAASLLVIVLTLATAAAARPFIVLVYNVENLVDADGRASFEDYQPARYSRAHVLTKLQNITKVVARFENGRGPDVIMFEEIEVDLTPAKAPLDYDAILRRYAGTTIEEMLGAKFDAEVADLPSEALLDKAFADRGMTGYQVIPAENVRAPGSTHALAQKCVIFTRFPVKAVQSHPTVDARAILEVRVDVDGAPLYLFDNHWKSGASDPQTEKARVENAKTLRRRLDEILKDDPNADVIIGGDFNSQYNQKQRYPKMAVTGINDVLGSQGNELAVRGDRDLYNLWFELPRAERGSDTFRGEWGTLMQIMITRGLYDYRGVQYVDNSFGVAKIAGLNMDDEGLPIRWSFDGPAGSGFSDHFPVYAKFVTVADNRTDRYIALRNASDGVDTSATAPKIDFSKIDLAKVAVSAADLPPGASLRSDAYKGKIVRVEGKVGRGKRLTVEFRGDIYDLWSFDAPLRDKLRAKYKAGEPIQFYGELGQYKGRWQFIVRDESWVK